MGGLFKLSRSTAFGFCLIAIAGLAVILALRPLSPDQILARDAKRIAHDVARAAATLAAPQAPEIVTSGVMRYAVLDSALTPVAVSSRFLSGEIARLAADPLFARTATDVMSSRREALSSVVYDTAAGGDLTRVVVSATTEDGAPRLVVVDIDQSDTAAILDQIMTTIGFVVVTLLLIAIGVPSILAMRRSQVRRAAEEHIRFLALHDPLTGLPNRVQLKERLTHALARARRRNRPVGVLCLDLDRFKEVNDTLGHSAGDALLVDVGERLRNSLRETDVVARLGGDEFAIVIEDPTALSDLASMSRRLCRELAKPYQINGHDFSTSGSIGIAVGPVDGATPDALLRNADLALYRSKADGRNTYSFFEAAMDDALKERSMLEQDLRLALNNKELHLAYQPQFDLQTGRLCGYEALLRWQHPTRGNVPPDTFIPLAEESGLIHAIGEWVLVTAFTEAARWSQQLKLAINLSPTQFKTGDIAETIVHYLRQHGLDPSRLEVEIAETMLLDQTGVVIARLHKLREAGVTVTIDDFGTGYSSLSYLSRFPFDKIKIDRTFVAALRKPGDSSAIIDTIIGVGESLGVEIAAEGIEVQAQADALREAGCRTVQGFLYGAPQEDVSGKNKLLHLTTTNAA